MPARISRDYSWQPAAATLLLDEIADLPLPVQVKLLRVIQEKSVRPVGSETEIPIDVRILSATHKNLSLEIQRGNFRDDLYYRVNVIGLHVPALRERREDIPALVSHLLAKMADELGTGTKTLSPEARNQLMKHEFPGNIRELENMLARASALSESGTIDAADLAPTSTFAIPDTAVERSIQDAQPPVPSSADLLAEVDGDLEGYLADRERGNPRRGVDSPSLEQNSHGKGTGNQLPQPALSPEKAGSGRLIWAGAPIADKPGPADPISPPLTSCCHRPDRRIKTSGCDRRGHRQPR